MSKKIATPVRMIIQPSSVGIPAASARREPPRPGNLRPSGYAELFDAETLYFDVFREGSKLVAIGPPLLNLAPDVNGWHFATDAGAMTVPRVIPRDRSHRAVFSAAAGASQFTVADRTSSQTVSIGPDLSSVFAGTRALMTHQLDNDLDWVRDWVTWHVRAHGTDAVLIYDNGSTSYSLRELLDAACVDGIRAAAVVDWSFRFGPQGGPDVPWDSDFTQYGAIEHARRRILRRAAGMLSVDIDELVHSGGDRTVYDFAAASPHGFVLFPGTWAYADPEAGSARPRHADCQWVRTGDDPAATKWCAVPSRLSERSQLVVHLAHDLRMSTTDPISYWHLRPISTHWKFDRSTSGDARNTLVHSPLIEAQVGRYLLAEESPSVIPLRGRAPSEHLNSALRLLNWRIRRAARRLVRGR